VVGYRDLSKLGETLKPILIRRTKDEVLHDLPERLDKTFFVPMTKQQMEHHEENRDVVARIVAKWRRYGFLTEAEQRILMCALQNMRMSCNSTYLLDHETDHGVKADELVELLAEVFERPDTKAVVFSQWTRTHELLINRFESRNWKHVFFHGGVPGKKRKDLIDRFKEDPENRVFLSTDAGGVGLNLQNANVVVIMDQPWNPAVLEQRIGRVHRLGQHQPVRVVHFVAQGTIEHGMLDVLSFKKSMFEGVLDGGQNEVFLGGSRLKKFMESVEKVSNAIPEAMPRQASTNGKEAEVEAEPDTAPPREEEREEEPSVAAVEKQPWEELLSAGLDFVNKLGKTLNVQASSGEGSPRSARSPLAVTEDEETGQPCLKIPIPEPEMLQNLAEMLGRFAKALAGK
jgi:superfamily II DNA/RNA helicase